MCTSWIVFSGPTLKFILIKSEGAKKKAGKASKKSWVLTDNDSGSNVSLIVAPKSYPKPALPIISIMC